MSIEGPSEAQDVATAQQVAVFVASGVLPAGPGYYSVFFGSAGEGSEASWVHGAAQVSVDANSTDPTLAGQLATAMRVWPNGGS